jgi:sigma-B regulation protein RsbU (phosphoserine phosphatase)
MPSKKTDAERKTIGVFLAQVNRVWGAEFISGVIQAAEAQDVNLVCFIGGKPVPLGTPDQPQPSYGLYDLARSGRFDGLILAADIGHGLNPGQIQEFCRSFAPIPMVAHAIDVDGIPYHLIDNITGMRAVIRHLIEVHGHQRIAFVRGPGGQLEAEQRFQAYQQELQAHQIAFDENLVVTGDYSPESGRAAIGTLLDERGVRFQAIAASNDRMAFGALEALQMRGLSVPDAIALTGFDNSREAQILGVPLTTVNQSFSEIGRGALESLLELIAGKKVPPKTLVKSELIVRWSCGCMPEIVTNAAIASHEVAHTGRLQNKRDAAVEALLNSASIDRKSASLEHFKDLFGQMWDVLLTSMQADTSGTDFLRITNTVLVELREHGSHHATWHNLISMLRRYALGGISDPATMLRAENLFQQARLMTGEFSQRTQALGRLQLEQQEDVFQDFGFSIAPAMRLEEIGEAISRNFPRMGIERWYVMFYSDVVKPHSTSQPPPENYRLLFQYDEKKFEIPSEVINLGTGSLVPHGKTPTGQRYTAVIMPLSLAQKRFGFMWVEMGPKDWDVYTRIRNLVSSALLRTMLFEQREQAQAAVERLLEEARDHAKELAVARDMAEKAAIEKEKLYDSEQTRRRVAEGLARAARQISSLEKLEKVPQQIIAQMREVIHFDRGVLYLEDVDGIPQVVAHHGFPPNADVESLRYQLEEDDMYEAVARMKEAIQIGDVINLKGWQQPDWVPADRSWIGAPLYFKDRVMGMIVLTRSQPWAYTRDDALTVNTYAVQAAIAIENARLYDEINRFNLMMERMVAQRVEELHTAYTTLEKLDQNKSTFIQVAAHELRTPLTVIKGYLGMIQGDALIRESAILVKAVEGVMQGTNRLHLIVNSMLDVARLENQVLTLQLELLPVMPILGSIKKELQEDLQARNISLQIDDSISGLPALQLDPELIKKALDNIIINGIKFTPDGGSVTVSATQSADEHEHACAEIRIQDTGIGIDPSNLDIIFEKLYQLGKVELHSSGRSTFKGGGPGLGLAIASGIVKAHGGKVWAESTGYDEETCPGSSFYVRLPLPEPEGDN